MSAAATRWMLARGRSTLHSLLLVIATAAALLLPGVTTSFLPDAARAASVGLGLLILPGCIAARALRLSSGAVWQRLAIAFTFSLALVVPGLLTALVTGTGVGTVVVVLLTLCAAIVWCSRAFGPARALARDSTSSADGHDVAQRTDLVLVAATVLTLVALTAAAVAVTRTGSVDRWWYLGYVRAWMTGPIASQEPFLASGFTQPRFAFHTWLGALAVWAHGARVDPLWLWDRACPALLMPLAFASQAMLGDTLLRSRRGALLAALCAGLLMAGGGPIAGLTRLPEDKVLAALVLSPVMWAAGVRACETGGAWIAAGGLAAVALATIHPLGFMLSAGPVFAFAILQAAREPPLRRNVAGLVVVLLTASSYPLASGWIVRRAYVADGAAAVTADHPVARVHRSRQRLIDAGRLGYAVDPRLLAQPIALLALAGIPLLRRRSVRERTFLAPAALVPLAVAFVPPLTAAAGTVILPWMVHRVLWAIPFSALAAIAADELTGILRGRIPLTVALLIAMTVPAARSAALARTREEREVLKLPPSSSLHQMLAAVSALPPDALLAAAPELSERIPGLTGARVLAMSDRATVVFAGSRRAGEARLRERAAIFAGLWKASDDAPAPTHVLFAPTAAAAARYCTHELLRNDAFVLCGFGFAAVPPGIRMPKLAAGGDGAERVSVAATLSAPSSANGAASPGVETPALRQTVISRCESPTRVGTPLGRGGLTRPRSGPWSAEFPRLSCSIETSDGTLAPRTLLLEPALGTAVEELTIQATGLRGDQVRWRVRSRQRAHDGDVLRFGLPRGDVDRVLIEIEPSFLPFVKLRTFELTLDAPADSP